MAEHYKHTYKVDFYLPLKRFDVGDILASGDEKANSFEVAVFRDGSEVDMTGYTVRGYFIRPNDETIALNGTANGNVVCVEPSKNCYAYDGAFSLAIKITGSGFTGTVAVFDGRIVRTTSENIVDGDRVIYGLEDLLAQIAATENAAANANAAAENADESAHRANQAAAAIENVSASATGLETGAAPTVEVVNTSDGKYFHFGLPRGEKGDKGDPGTIENVTITSINGLPEALEGKMDAGGYNPNTFLGTDENGNVVEKEVPSPVETDPTVPGWAKEPKKPAYTASEVGAAPVGFGLSSAELVTTDVDNVTKPGWYCLSNTFSIAGITANYWFLHVSAYRDGSTHCVQRFYPCTGENGYIEIVRRKTSGEWEPAEVVNPPLALGVEYRTTERYQGKPVFVKAVNFGQLPASAAKNVVFYSSNPGATALFVQVILSDGCVLNSGYNKDRSLSSEYGIWVDNTKYNIRIVTEANFANVTAVVVVKYVKD